MPDLTSQALPGTCLAFDYGLRRIGTAVGEYRMGSARPLLVINNEHGTPDWPALDALVAEWKPTDLVVGLPLTESGEEQMITAHARGFMKRLGKRYQLPVHPCDERYSSVAASEAIRHMRRSGQRRKKTSRADVDTIAAALILEDWFSMHASSA